MSYRNQLRSSFDILSTVGSSLSPSSFRLLRAAEEHAALLGFSLFLVGGPVRDLLLGKPIRDLDLVVEGDAATLAFNVAKEFPGDVTTHYRFRTATLETNQQRLDIATARQEIYPKSGALPKVSPSSIHQDLERRDFTINAMAISLSGPNPYVTLDPTNGTLDLEHHLVRVLHDRSFIDDATRILRAIKYEQRLSFRLETKTLRLLLQAVAVGALNTISSDRLRHELELILLEERPDLILARAGELGIMRSLYKPLGELSWLQPAKRNNTKRDPMEYLAALAHPLNIEEGEGFIARLNLPTLSATTVRDAITLRNLEPKLKARALSITRLCDILDELSPASIKTRISLTPELMVRRRLKQYLSRLRQIKPSLTGKDLLELGYPQGPHIGNILGRLRSDRLKGVITNRQEELDLAKKCLRTKGEA